MCVSKAHTSERANSKQAAKHLVFGESHVGQTLDEGRGQLLRGTCCKFSNYYTCDLLQVFKFLYMRPAASFQISIHATCCKFQITIHATCCKFQITIHATCCKFSNYCTCDLLQVFKLLYMRPAASFQITIYATCCKFSSYYICVYMRISYIHTRIYL
jgi:hypothetical protein